MSQTSDEAIERILARALFTAKQVGYARDALKGALVTREGNDTIIRIPGVGAQDLDFALSSADVLVSFIERMHEMSNR